MGFYAVGPSNSFWFEHFQLLVLVIKLWVRIEQGVGEKLRVDIEQGEDEKLWVDIEQGMGEKLWVSNKEWVSNCGYRTRNG